MARGFRHTHISCAADRSASQRTVSPTITPSDDASQRPTDDAPSEVQPSQQRGRKMLCETKLKMPLRATKVALLPSGDMQFTYVNYKPPYKYTSQLGVILKREHPGVVEDTDQDGIVLRKRAATDWADYFLIENELGETAGDRVLSEFWRLFQVSTEDRQEAERVLGNYLKKRVRDMIYAARVDAVKCYYWKKHDQKLDDTSSRPLELEYEQYKDGQLWWCNDEVWPYLCRYWCSTEFLKKRKRGQESRLSSEDPAQNRGGSRPLSETQQLLGALFGPEKATQLNTYAVMKSGIKSMNMNGSNGPISSNKAQKRIDDYIAGFRKIAHPEEEDEEHDNMEEELAQEPTLNGQVLYEVSGGTPHGHVAIGYGAVRTADVRAAAKEKNVRPSNSVSIQSLARENAHLHEGLHEERGENARLHQQSQIATSLLLGLYRELGKEIPAEAKQLLSSPQENVTGSSHAGSESDNTEGDNNHGLSSS